MENINKAVNVDLVTEGVRRLWDGIRGNLELRDLPGEIWKYAEDGNDIYEVSSFMRVKVSQRIVSANKGGKMIKHPQILKQKLNSDGYWEVRFTVEGKRIGKRVHRLYTVAYYQNPFKNTVVNHKNLIKSDNIPCNLEVVTPYYNAVHAKINGAIHCGEAVKHSKLKNVDVLHIFNSKEPHNVLAERYKVNTHSIYKIKAGKTWSLITGKTYKKNGLDK